MSDAQGEARFRTMADHAPVMLWLADTRGECEFFNKQWLDFTGRSMEQELGVGWAENVHFEDFQACMHTYLESFAKREGFRMEYRLLRADGAFRWILDTGTPRYESGVFAGFVGSCIDITEIRDARDMQQRLNEELERRVADRTVELEKRVDEREVLIREIHHRVKNNLQLISSLLNLQKAGLDIKGRAALDETQSRIRSISLVHQRLYQVSDLSRVQMTTYVRELASNIHAALAAESVAIELAVDELDLPIDVAIPVGLILNELITNALKHAFPNGRDGRLAIAARAEGGVVTMSVADDGVGLPVEFDPAVTESLGFQVVVTLVEQLGAKLAIEREAGTKFTLVFAPTWP